MKPRLCTAIAVGLVIVLLAGSGVSVSAQPAATISLPEPGEAKELFAGCNLISLTLPDGTTSEEVIDAVTPPETLEALWRQTATLDRFEGFLPDFPQGSDLLAVGFLDPVWICIPKTPGPPATPTPTPEETVSSASSPTPTPAPGAGGQVKADLAITQLLASIPAGYLTVQFTNNGSDPLTGAAVGFSCGGTVHPYQHGIPSPEDAVATLPPVRTFLTPSTLSVSLAPGQTDYLGTDLWADLNKGVHGVECNITQVSFTGDELGNNTFRMVLALKADVALTDIFPSNLPKGDVFARITNNCPWDVDGAPVWLGCSAVRTGSDGSQSVHAIAPVELDIALYAGDTAEFDTYLNVDTSCVKYDVTCTLQATRDLPQPPAVSDNNRYAETIPMWEDGQIQ